jgi:uncharacterized protein CbrC (UPF0167 family)
MSGEKDGVAKQTAQRYWWRTVHTESFEVVYTCAADWVVVAGDAAVFVVVVAAAVVVVVVAATAAAVVLTIVALAIVIVLVAAVVAGAVEVDSLANDLEGFHQSWKYWAWPHSTYYTFVDSVQTDSSSQLQH